jgi:hypothetical protein
MRRNASSSEQPEFSGRLAAAGVAQFLVIAFPGDARVHKLVEDIFDPRIAVKEVTDSVVAIFEALTSMEKKPEATVRPVKLQNCT